MTVVMIKMIKMMKMMKMMMIKLMMFLTVKSCDGGEEAKDDHYHHTGHQVDKDLQL